MSPKSLSPWFLLATMLTASIACSVPVRRGSSTPTPPDLSTTPTPEGGVLGGLRGLFQSDPIPTGCYAFLRLYEDGVVLWAANICPDSGPNSLETLLTWFHRDNADVIHGTYWTSGDQIWMELPTPYLHDEIHLTDLRGRFCMDALALQTMRRYSQFYPSVSAPVTRYNRLDTAVADTSCHVAPFYAWITPPGKPGGPLNLIVQTNPGEICTLTYQNPEETAPLVENLTTTADETGRCLWSVELPSDTHPGKGQAAFTVARITKVIEVIVNSR